MGPSKNNIKFFDYSSTLLNNKCKNLSSNNNIAVLSSSSNSKISFNLKKMGQTILWVVLAIIIKSLFQYLCGAEDITLMKIFSALDYPFYQGCVLGGCIMVFIRDNWKLIWDSFWESITLKLDSGDECSGDEAVKKSWKGKDKVTDK